MNPHELATASMHQIGGVCWFIFSVGINLNRTTQDLLIPTWTWLPDSFDALNYAV